MSGVFFRGGTATARPACPAGDHILIQQLSAAAGDGVRIQAQEVAQQGVAAVPQADRFQAGEQAALLFVEQSMEQQDGGLEFVGRDLQGVGANGKWNRLGTAARQDLVAPNGGIDGGVEELATACGSAQALLLHQQAQRLLDSGLEEVSQLPSVVAVGGGQDEGFHRGYQGAVAREPDPFVRPQSASIKAGDLDQSVEASAMGVAGEITELLEFAEYGEIGGGAEHAFEFRQIGDLVTVQVLTQQSRVEGTAVQIS